MASSENLASIDQWVFRQALADSWISEAFARDTETLTKALQKSISNHSDAVAACDTFPPLILNDLLKPEPAQTPSVSGVSGSDHETAPKRRPPAVPGAAGGKISKRKSRATKRSQTTYITADPAHFRQMVQQVTGVRFGHSQLPVNPILKPEPKRPVNRLLGCLPTLDTSEFMLDHRHQQVMGAGAGTGGGMTFHQPVVADGGATALDFETFPSFPTLESWKVM